MVVTTHFDFGQKVKVWWHGQTLEAEVTRVEVQVKKEYTAVYYDLKLENGHFYEDVVEEELVEFKNELEMKV